MANDRFVAALVIEFSKIYGKPSCLGILTRVYENMNTEEKAENKRLFETIASLLK